MSIIAGGKDSKLKVCSHCKMRIRHRGRLAELQVLAFFAIKSGKYSVQVNIQ